MSTSGNMSKETVEKKYINDQKYNEMKKKLLTELDRAYPSHD